MKPDSSYSIGAELEFYLLSPSGEVIADLETGSFPKKKYSLAEAWVPNYNYFAELINIYTIQPESGAGQFEVQFKPEANLAELADKINKFKELALVAAGRAGLLLSFEAKPVKNQPGSSLHVHYSNNLFDPWGLIANKGVVLLKKEPDNDYVLWAIGGMLEKMAQDTPIFLPTEESKLRIEPWFNAPTKICWGYNNRSTAIRIPDGKPKRIEHRVCGADVDAQAALKAIVDAAEYGISKQIKPDEPIFGNAWEEKYSRPSII